MKHHASPEFWALLDALPSRIQDLAYKNFALLKADSRHPSLQFKPVGAYRSVRVGIHHRALAIPVDDGFLWFWIGTHAAYDRLLA